MTRQSRSREVESIDRKVENQLLDRLILKSSDMFEERRHCAAPSRLLRWRSGVNVLNRPQNKKKQ